MLAEFQSITISVDVSRLPLDRVVVGSFVMVVGELEWPQVWAVCPYSLSDNFCAYMLSFVTGGNRIW